MSNSTIIWPRKVKHHMCGHQNLKHVFTQGAESLKIKHNLLSLAHQVGQNMSKKEQSISPPLNAASVLSFLDLEKSC